MPKAYAYIRFSDEKQNSGTSHTRQLQDIKDYCIRNGLDLQDTVYFDRGKSAFHGHHLRLKGRLHDFLKDCKSGIIPIGSALVLEKMDRLTRLNYIDAQDLIRELMGTVEIHFISDNLVINPKTYTENIGIIYQVVGKVYGAYEYSKGLSERIKKTNQIKLEKARNGTGKMPGSYPSWMKRTGDVFDLIPEKVEVLRMIIDLKSQGIGVQGIARRLNEQGIPPISRAKQWNKPFIKHLFQDPAIYGGLQKYIYHKNGPRTPGEIIEGYYPAVISKQEWQKLSYSREILNKRGRPGLVNPFAKVLVCEVCGHPLYIRGAVLGTGKSVRYVYCNYSNSGNNCSNSNGFNLSALVDGFLLINGKLLSSKDIRSNTGEKIKAIEAKVLEWRSFLDDAKKDLGDLNREIRDVAKANIRKASERLDSLGEELNSLQRILSSEANSVKFSDMVSVFKDKSKVIDANEFMRIHFNKLALNMTTGRLTIELANGNCYLATFEIPNRGQRKMGLLPKIISCVPHPPIQ